MFKHIFGTKQNQDPTLQEKSLSVYKYGRLGCYVFLILGTIASYLLATWVGNVLQSIIAFFALVFTMHFSAILPIFSKLFSWEAVFHNEYLLDAVFVYHGKFIASCARGLGFLVSEIFVGRQFLDVFVKYRKLNHGEHGTDRIATPQEVASETNAIPDRGYRYDFPSGAIMMHKMNLKGRINKVVKQQLYSLKQYFRIDSSHDSSGKQFKRFYRIVKTITLTILSVLIILGICGCIQYNFGSGHGFLTVFFIPWLILWYIIHFVLRGILDLIIDLFKLQINVFSLPILLIPIVLIIEGAVVYFIIGESYRTIHKSTKYSSIHSYIQVPQQNTIQKYAHRKHLQHKKAYHYLKTQLEKLKNPQIVDDEMNNSNEENDANNTVPIMQHKFPRIYLLKLWMRPMFHHKHPFLRSPVKSLWMAILQGANDLLSLDSGITGWYYLTAGNGAMQNVLLYGITRSGKGQMIVNTIVDINSRCSPRYQKNMIFNDSKGELAAMSYRTLKKRGYDVKVLNIMDMSHSMSYNPLALVIKQARAGAIGAAAQACSELSFTIYNPKGQGQNSYFYTSAASLFDSIAFAQLALAHSRYYGLDDFKTDKPNHKGAHVHDDGKAMGKPKNDGKYYKDKNGIVHSDINAWSRITINNILQMTIQLGGENAQMGSDQLDTANQLIIYFMHLQQRLNKLRDRKNSNPDSMTEVWDDHLSLLNQAVLEFQNSKMAGGKTAGSIYSTFLDRLRIYQQPEVSQMTSMNNYNAEEMGFDRLFTIQFSRHFKLQNITTKLFGEKITKKRDSHGKVVTDKNGRPVTESHVDKDSLIETNHSHLNGIGLARVPFEKAINYRTFYIEITIHDERINQDFTFWIKCHKHYYQPNEYLAISHNYHIAPKVADLTIINRHKKNEQVIDKYTKKKALKGIQLKVIKLPNSEDYSKNTSELNDLAGSPRHAVRQMRFLYNPRPTALFLVTPPNATELNQLCTFLINQTFNILSNYSLRIAKGRHIQRPLQFILDELGNIPAIPNLSKKVSIGLSQHIEFMLVFQNFEQIVKNYKKDEAHSIISNCSTTYYILSKSDQTIKQVSDAFGTRTIQTTGLNQDPTKIKSANYNHSLTAQKVMPPGVLRRLRPGQIAILRTNDRSTTTGKEVKPWPIFDTGKYILPYSFWFLKKYESNDSLNSLPVVTPHKYLNLEDVTVQFNKIYQWLEIKQPLDMAYVKSTVTRVNNEIDSYVLGQQFKNNFTLILNAAVKTGNPAKVLKTAAQVEKMMQKYAPLAKGRDIGQICQYVLAVITQGISNVDTLHDVNPTHQGYNIFNFVVHQYDYAIQYYDSVRDIMETHLPSKKYVKAVKPVLYAPENIQIYCALVSFIESQASKENDKKASSDEMKASNESWLLSQINLVFNTYLDRVGLIHTDSNDNNHLTQMGKTIIGNASYMVKTFFKDNTFSYQPNTSLIKIILPILQNLDWVAKRPKYNHYYGLTFAQGIVNYNRYQEFCNYTDKDGNARTLALSPMSYASSLMTIMDALLLHPELSKEIKQGHKFQISSACQSCLKQFGQLDSTAQDIVSNPDDENQDTQDANDEVNSNN